MITYGLPGWLAAQHHRFYIILITFVTLVLHALIKTNPWTGSIAAVMLASCWFPLDNR
jgi:hypothetical protein